MSFSLRVYNNQKGFGLIEVLAVVVILSISLLTIIQLSVSVNQQSAQMSSLTEVDIFRRKLLAILSDNDSWRLTMSLNPEMNCLRTLRSSVICGNVGYNPNTNPRFTLYNQERLDDEALTNGSTTAPAPVFDSRVESNGITMGGKRCNTFSSTTTSLDCPFRFEMRWYAIASSKSPQVAVYAILRTTPGFKVPINLNNYSIGYIDQGQLKNPFVRSAL